MAKVKFSFSFRIWPDYGDVFYRVTIHANKRAMYNALKGCRPHNFEAICRTFETFRVTPGTGPDVFTGEIGHVHFHNKQFRAGILAHELLHAVLGYFDFRRKRAPIKFRRKERDGHVDNMEEAQCWVMGELYRQAALSFERGKEYRAGRNVNVWFGKTPKYCLGFKIEKA